MGSTGGFSDEEEEEEGDEITNSKNKLNKDWLKPAVKSLSKLDEVKPSVYNFGLSDARTLKPTSNLRDRKVQSDSNTETLNTSYTANKHAWGSSGSIPDLLKQHNVKNRPESAKQHRPTRPPSGKRPRPQSAKPDHSFTPHPPDQPSITILGSKFDPADRPPKSTPHQNVSTGWVAKTHEKRTSKRSGKVQGSAPPPSPLGWLDSPDLIDQNRIHYEDDAIGDVELRSCPSPILHHPPPEPIHLSLPHMGTVMEDEDDELDTERLLQKAAEVSKAVNEEELAEKSGELYHNGDELGRGHRDIELNLMPCVTEEEQDYWSDIVIGRENISDLSDDKIGSIFSDSSDDEAGSHSYTGIKSHNAQNLISHRKKSANDTPVKPGHKSCVKFMEDRNVTVDITPRNIGRKVEELSKRKPKTDETRPGSSKFKVKSKSVSDSDGSGNVTDDGKHNDLCDLDFDGQLSVINGHGIKIGREFPATESREISSEMRNLKSRQRLATTTNKTAYFESRSLTPVAMVTVDYGNEPEIKENVDNNKEKKVRLQGHSIETMMSMLSFNDQVEKQTADPSNNLKAEPEVNRDLTLTPDPQPQITVCRSGPEVNYYEMTKKGNQSKDNVPNFSDDELGSTPLVMTTKTLQFDKVQPSETKVKSVVQPLPSRQKEFTYLPRNSALTEERTNSGLSKRPSSAKVPKKPPSVARLNLSSLNDEGRPGSRLGFVDMGADGREAGDHGTFLVEDHGKAETVTRPAKNTLLRRPRSSSFGVKPKVLTEETFRWTETKFSDPPRVSDPPLTPPSPSPSGDNMTLDEDDISAVVAGVGDFHMDINLPAPVKLAAKTPLSPLTKTREKTIQRKSRPISAPAFKPTTMVTKPPKCGGSSKQRDVASKLLKENSFSSSLLNRHYSSYSRSASAPVRRRSAPAAQTKPPIYIVTKKFDPNIVEYDSPEIQQCRDLQWRLAENGVDVNLNSLKRALLPPDGTTYYYDTTAELPKSNSYGLLSHPKVWLPEEYQKLQQAKKKLARADEMLRLQRMEEEREARPSETPVKKKKKKGKKGIKGMKKLKRSKSIYC